MVKTVNFDLQEEILDVESIISRGMNHFSILGINNKSKSELKSRIRMAFKSSLFNFPKGNIIVNIHNNNNYSLKNNYFDLPIAISILKTLNKIKSTENYVFVGQLNIDGSINPVENPIRIISICKKFNIKNIILGKGDYEYISIFKDINIFIANNLLEVVNHLNKVKSLEKININNYLIKKDIFDLDINDIYSQDRLIRALIIAISGRHSILIKGPIGVGKTYTIKAIKSILPDLNYEEALKLHDIKIRLKMNEYFTNIPNIVIPNINSNIKQLFGNNKQIGIVSLANFGLLVFDEINLYDKKILNKLKLLLDNYSDEMNFNYLIDYTFIGIMNSCPCGNYGTDKKCSCTMNQINKFNEKIDKSIYDRFQIKIICNNIKNTYKNEKKYDIENIKNNIKNTYKIQKDRYRENNKNNGNLISKDIEKYIEIEDNIKNVIDKFSSKYDISKRGINNIIKVARTIADLDNSNKINNKHIFEAISYYINFN